MKSIFSLLVLLCFAGLVNAQTTPAAPKKEIKTASAEVEKPAVKDAKEVRSKVKKETKVVDPVQLGDAKSDAKPAKKVIKKAKGETAKNPKQ